MQGWGRGQEAQVVAGARQTQGWEARTRLLVVEVVGSTKRLVKPSRRARLREI